MIKLITYLDCVTNHRCLGLYFSYWEMIKEENTYTYIDSHIWRQIYLYTLGNENSFIHQFAKCTCMYIKTS